MLCLECNQELKPNCKKFCSNQCCINYLAKTNRKPRPNCLYCNTQLTGNLINKFCNQSCAAKFNNAKRKGENKKRKEYYCKHCGKFLSKGYIGRTTCSECNPNFIDWSNITLKQFKTRFPNIFQMNARIRDLARRTYKRSNKPEHCVNCGYDKFYEVCHIKAIKDFYDESKITEVNDLSNLIALCPNCHWELDHNLIQVA